MAATPTVYVICDQNCKFEGMTKEQILTAIAQAVETGTIGDLDTGFITTIKTINGTPLKFFVGEQAEYDALTAEEKEGLFAIITNDATKDGLLEAIEELQTNYKTLSEGLADGSFVVAKATELEHLYLQKITLKTDMYSHTTDEIIGTVYLKFNITTPISLTEAAVMNKVWSFLMPPNIEAGTAYYYSGEFANASDLTVEPIVSYIYESSAGENVNCAINTSTGYRGYIKEVKPYIFTVQLY